MFGRRVGSSLLRIQLNARLPLRPAPFQCQASSINALACRYYASPGRPRKTVGEPSRPVKRAVKKAAKSTEGGPAAKQVKAKKATAAAKKKTAKKPAKKPAATPKKGASPQRLDRGAAGGAESQARQSEDDRAEAGCLEAAA